MKSDYTFPTSKFSKLSENWEQHISLNILNGSRKNIAIQKNEVENASQKKK